MSAAVTVAVVSDRRDDRVV